MNTYIHIHNLNVWHDLLFLQYFHIPVRPSKRDECRKKNKQAVLIKRDSTQSNYTHHIITPLSLITHGHLTVLVERHSSHHITHHITHVNICTHHIHEHLDIIIFSRARPVAMWLQSTHASVQCFCTPTQLAINLWASQTSGNFCQPSIKVLAHFRKRRMFECFLIVIPTPNVNEHLLAIVHAALFNLDNLKQLQNCITNHASRQ